MSITMITAVKAHKIEIFDTNVNSASGLITTNAEDGEMLGLAVALLIGLPVGNSVGENVGAEVVGDFVGTLVVNFVGEIEGNVVGASVRSPRVSHNLFYIQKGNRHYNSSLPRTHFLVFALF